MYLVRHGETEYNRKRIVQGRKINSDLNDTGRRQADALGNYLANVRLDALYASPLNRARQTAAAIARHHTGLWLRTLPDLEEMSWGIYEGRDVTPDVREALRLYFDTWRNGHFSTPIEGGESIDDVHTRARRALDTIVQANNGRTVAVVTHGRWLRVLLASVLPDFELRRMDEIQHTNTGINLIHVEGATYRAEVLNGTTHLEALSAS